MAPPRKLQGHEEEIVAAYLAGATYLELADRYGVSPEPIRRILRQHTDSRRVGRRPSLLGREAEVLAAYEAGGTLNGVAAQFGVTKNVVRRTVVAAGGTVRRYTPRNRTTGS